MPNRRTSQTRDPGPTDDPLLSAAAVCGLMGGVSRMTLWRWQKAGVIPQPTVIRNRNYWRRSRIDGAIKAIENQCGAIRAADRAARLSARGSA